MHIIAALLRLKTADMLEITNTWIEQFFLGSVGECHFRRQPALLDEDPWERLPLRKCPTQAADAPARSEPGGIRHYPDGVVEAFVRIYRKWN